MEKKSRIYVAGHNGLVGGAILKKLQSSGYENVVTRKSSALDLRDQNEVELFFREENLEYVFLAAAKVGGINANNTYRGQFLYDNLMIQSNVIHSSHLHGVKKLLFLGSSCIYPKYASQPLKEDYLLTGPLEYTNEPYAIAKIAGIKMCENYRDQYGSDFISVMPTNLYGIGDNYHLENSHVLPAMIRKFHEGKIQQKQSITLWGDGSSKREFLFSSDLADACLFLMTHYSQKELINVGTGKDLAIAELAQMVKEIVGFKGEIKWDLSKPNGTPRKLMDVSKLNGLGWQYQTELKDGIILAYSDFKENMEKWVELH